MERAARVINSSKVTSKILTDDELIRGIWPSAVGKVIASHTSRLRVVRTTLVVEVADATWQKQLFAFRAAIRSGPTVRAIRSLIPAQRTKPSKFRILC
jgi:hypothetical protein